MAAAAVEASRQGFIPLVLTHAFAGCTEEIADCLTDLASAIVLEADHKMFKSLDRLCFDQDTVRRVYETLQQGHARLCLLAGGETTLKVPSNHGVGGRMAHLALRAATSLAVLQEHTARVTLLAGATDGLDGPTQLGGAMVTPQTLSRGIELGLNANMHLQNCDAYGYFQRLDDGRHIRPGGITGTNVMDIVVMVVERNL